MVKHHRDESEKFEANVSCRSTEVDHGDRSGPSDAKRRRPLQKTVIDETCDKIPVCATCENLNPTNEYVYQCENKLILKGIVFQDIIDSAKKGCSLCSVVHQSVNFVNGTSESSEDQPAYVNIKTRHGHPIQLRTLNNSKGFIDMIGLSGTEENDGQLPQFCVTRPVNERPNTTSSLTLAREWLQNCLETHELCRHGLLDEMPTRLLDIMPQEKEVDLMLVETKDLPSKVNYVALSHCWGTVENLVTTSENIHSMYKGVWISTLARTFQDAVELCRKLCFQYLWIDSLCIIQGDVMEWRREAGRMTTMYGNAGLVVVASASKGDDVGMYPPRLVHYYKDFPFGTNDDRLKIIVQPWREHDGHAFSGEGPLSERAWAYQERVLGNRVLLYHKEELSWECNESSRCECGVRDHIGDQNHKYNFKEILNAEVEDSIKLYRQWRLKIVSSYAYHNLTRSLDRLPALSGVAEVFKAKLEDDYLAGLWQKDLLNGLL